MFKGDPYVMLTVGFYLFVVCFTLYVNGSNHGLKQATAEDVLVEMKARRDPIDVVIASSVERAGDNYSVLSVARFAPWVRRIHLADPAFEYEDMARYVHEQRNARLVRFNGDLRAYCLTSPLLSEQFVILQEGRLFANYVWPWQFFFQATPTFRSCRLGAVALTRRLFNEIRFASLKEGHLLERQVDYALAKAVHDRNIKWGDNADHVVIPCSPLGPKSVVAVDPSLPTRSLQSLFAHTSVHKRPDQAVIVLTDQHDGDMTWDLGGLPADTVQLWVADSDSMSPHQRVSLHARTMAASNLIAEVRARTLNAEQLGAKVMRRVRALSKHAKVKVVKVVGPASSQKLMRAGNRLAQVYDTEFDPVKALAEAPDGKDNLELARLRLL